MSKKMIIKNNTDYLKSLSEQDKAYRENLAPGDKALYDYFGSMPAKSKNPSGTFKLDSAIGPELTVGDCTPELWGKIGHTG
jgi:hypothetical protein